MKTLYYMMRPPEPKPVPVEPQNKLEWVRWFETANRTVALTDLGNGVEVSTVFLGIDHNFGSEEEPVLWETLVFGLPDDDGYCDRYTSVDDARAGHARAVEHVTSLLGGT